MTIENISDITPSIVREFFKTDKFKFYLTGSRYFGSSGPLSDWDFFVEYTDEVEVFLKDLGFEDICNEDYLFDRVTNRTYRYQNVDVQLVINIEVKKKAQLLIKHHGLISANKKTNKMVWAAVIISLLCS